MVVMIFIALGSNLPGVYGSPRQACVQALTILEEYGVFSCAVSRWYTSAPVPRSDDPWYVNGVARVETALTPKDLLQALLTVESRFGREPTVVNAPRTLDLDLLVYGDRVFQDDTLTLPHPRMTERAFVLLPLADIAPDWHHPVTKEGIDSMISRLPSGQEIFLEDQRTKEDDCVA